MKKFLSLLALMLVTSISAWADFTPKTVEGNTVYYYTLKCHGAGHANVEYIGLTENSFNGHSASGTCFAFEPTETDGQYYIKSVVRGKYLNAESGVTFDANPRTYWTIDQTGNYFFLYANGDNTKYLNNNVSSGVGLRVGNFNGECSQWTATEYSYTLPSVPQNVKLYRFKNKYYSSKYMAVNANGGLVATEKAESNTQWFYTIAGENSTFYFASAVDGRTAKNLGQSKQFTFGYGNNTAFVLDEYVIDETTYVGIRQNGLEATATNSSMHCDASSNIVGWASKDNATTTTNASMWTMEEIPESELGGQAAATIIAKAMLNASTIGIGDEHSCLRSIVGTELAKNIVIGMPVQSVRDGLQAAYDNATTTADYETLKAAYNTYKTSNRLYLPTGYYYFRSIANDANRNQHYLYNNYFLENNDVHHTLQSEAKITSNVGIWYIVNNGTSITIKNGDGQPLVQGNERQGNTGSVTVRNSLTFGSYNVSKFVEWGNKGIYFTEGLNAANANNPYSVNNTTETRFVTTWAGQPNAKDDNWTFEPVENPNIYNVVILGADGYVTYSEQYAFNGGFFSAESIAENEIEASDVIGFNKSVSINGNTITVTYVDESLDLSESNQYIIKNPAANKYVAANLGSADEAGAEKFLKLETGDKATVAEVEYNCFKLFSVGSLAYVGKSSASQDLTTEGAKKFGLVNTAADAVTFIYVGDDIIPVVDGTASEKAWNWHGGAAANNPVGLYTTGDPNSRWEFINIVDAAKVALNSAINNNYKSHIGNGLNQYATTEAYTTAIANGNAIYNSDNTTVAAVNEATAAINSAIEGLQINQPAAGSFVRVRSVKSGMGYVNAEASTVHTDALKVGAKGTSSIYYYDGTHLLAYCNGQYLVKNNDGSGFLALGAVGTDGCTIAFEKTSAKLGAYAVKYAGNRYLYAEDNASNTDAGSIVANDGYTFWLEQVNELPVTIAASGLTTFYAPVKMKVNGDVNVYVGAIDADESVITYTKLADQKIPAGTGVLIKSEQSGSITISPIDEEVEAQTSCLVGHEYTEACTQTSESHGDKYIYTLQSGVFKYYTGTKLTGFKAHLELNDDHRDANGNSNLRVVFTDETLTGIESIAAEDNQSIFDLQGRRVNNAQKGIYIMNGKKVLR